MVEAATDAIMLQCLILKQKGGKYIKTNDPLINQKFSITPFSGSEELYMYV